jgi:hypothetical protein
MTCKKTTKPKIDVLAKDDMSTSNLLTVSIPPYGAFDIDGFKHVLSSTRENQENSKPCDLQNIKSKINYSHVIAVKKLMPKSRHANGPTLRPVSLTQEDFHFRAATVIEQIEKTVRETSTDNNNMVKVVSLSIKLGRLLETSDARDDFLPRVRKATKQNNALGKHNEGRSIHNQNKKNDAMKWNKLALSIPKESGKTMKRHSANLSKHIKDELGLTITPKTISNFLSSKKRK